MSPLVEDALRVVVVTDAERDEILTTLASRGLAYDYCFVDTAEGWRLDLSERAWSRLPLFVAALLPGRPSTGRRALTPEEVAEQRAAAPYRC